MRQKARNLAKLAYHVGRLSLGLIVYGITKKSLPFSYQSMITLYCMTQGKSNDFISSLIARFSFRREFEGNAPVEGVLGTLNKAQIADYKAQIDQKGYFIFPVKLPEEMISDLLKVGLQEKATVRGKVESLKQAYNPENVSGTRYDFSAADLLKNEVVQKLVADASLRAVAAEYLGTDPVMDLVAMWWHTAYSKEPSKEAAQFFHFDMDRIKWLKFFFYVTDVTPETGPHCFVAESHRAGSTPKSLLNQGYARLTDQEVEAVFPKENLIEFNGPRGLILAEDTRGLHKGKHVLSGHRLIFQLEYTNSLFGGALDSIKLGKVKSAALNELVQKKSKLLKAFELTE